MHTVTLVLRDGDQIRDIRHFRTGFRTEEIRDGVFLLNGAPVKFHGVNRHEHDPRRGRAITREGMLEDMRLMKEGNFNAGRADPSNHPFVSSQQF